MESWQVVRVFVINFIDYNILIKILSALFLMALLVRLLLLLHCYARLQFLIKFAIYNINSIHSSRPRSSLSEPDSSIRSLV